MKKSVLLILATIFGFYACEQVGAGADASLSESTAVTAQPAVEKQAPVANKPDYQVKAEGMSRTTIEFAAENYDFGQVMQGEKVPHKFKFTNTGAEPLLITNVKPSCGCTASSYSDELVAPGETGYIDVEFNSAGRTGMQNKQVVVTGNFDGSITRTLRLSGEVVREGE